MRHRLRNAQNRQGGASFETAFAYRASLANVLCVRNGQTVRWLPGGKVVVVKSNLDWTLIRRNHPPVFADTKAYAGHRVAKSSLAPHQIALAAQYAHHGALAGFVVHLRAADAVIFFPIQAFSPTAARQGLGMEDGVMLGTLAAFDVTRMWETK